MFSIRRDKRRFSPFAISAVIGMVGMASNARTADYATAEPVPEPSFDNARFEAKQPKRKWSLIVGAGAAYEPEYEGSGDFKVSPVPFVVFTYGDWLEIDPRGISATIFQENNLSFSANIGWESGRDQDDHERLRGLGDIDFAVTVGAKASYEWGPVEFYATVDQTIDGSESLLGTFGLEYSAPVTEKLILGASAEAIVANDKHMQAYFGVNSSQSAASGLPEYKAKAGLKRVNVSASATYLLTENWLVRSEVGVGFLTGDAADSPIVEEKTQPSASIFVGYNF
ncbi:MipA/OmpV family protein [Rhizobium terrae]|uniref:MipA/OmpV family protein n=1 Tax=Rhizobium terrae TaxID=2171756 RepID=UPI000E3E3CD3|nr:MipA/OmpV family protein [Rhizobium terrae]